MNSPDSKANRLIHATSPYLRQHVYNPVDWYEWGQEALDLAAANDKPIIVSIGYSACHWCHVMAHECFENDDIAQIMNEHFVCIKVDREERPDIDQIYMEAVQAMNQNGGWPLNVFLTPACEPFYGGTYFPPPAWTQVLLNVSKAFKTKRADINNSAKSLTHHLQTSDVSRLSAGGASGSFSKENLTTMFETLVSRFDNEWGGIEKAPKFVMPSIWMFLLRYHHLHPQSGALEMVLHTIRNMSRGGLYDQLGGGYARYSVDREWFVPHFEKMLYDNAQLLSLLAEVFQVTHDEYIKTLADETRMWLEREMTHPQGGLYSALDADSEGDEGKYYTWTHTEIVELLGNNSLTERYFQISKEGNWEHEKNILIAKKNSLPDDPARLAAEKDKLLTARHERMRPHLDDKVLSGWNAMAAVGLMDAFRAFNDDRYLEQAIRIIHFIENNLVRHQKLMRAYKDKAGQTEAFLEDYAYLILCYLSAYEISFDERYLSKCTYWLEYTIEQFYDPEEKFFFYTARQAEKLISRKKEIFDNVIPSSNALIARALFRVGTLMDNNSWIAMAREMVSKLQSTITAEPAYMSYWGIVLAEMTHGLHEVVISGKSASQYGHILQKHFVPFCVFCGASEGSTLPLLQERQASGQDTIIYVCRNKTCDLPVKDPMDALPAINK